MGLREQKRDRTEDAIVRVAFRLFREQGYNETTVDQIAAESDISPRTFYRYFDTKDAVLAVNGFRAVDRTLDKVRPGASIDELSRALAEAIDDSQGHEYTDGVRRVLRENPELRDRPTLWRAQWADHMADGLAFKEGRNEPNQRDKLRASMTLLLTGLAVDEHLYRGGEGQDVSDVLEETLRAFRAGLLPPRDDRSD